MPPRAQSSLLYLRKEEDKSRPCSPSPSSWRGQGHPSLARPGLWDPCHPQPAGNGYRRPTARPGDLAARAACEALPRGDWGAVGPQGSAGLLGARRRPAQRGGRLSPDARLSKWTPAVSGSGFILGRVPLASARPWFWGPSAGGGRPGRVQEGTESEQSFTTLTTEISPKNQEEPEPSVCPAGRQRHRPRSHRASSRRCFLGGASSRRH